MTILTLRKGDDLVLTAAFTVGNVAQDMTGWSIKASMQYANCQAVELQAELTDEPGGIGVVSLASEETSGLQVGEYELQVRAIDTAGRKSSCAPVVVQVRE